MVRRCQENANAELVFLKVPVLREAGVAAVMARQNVRAHCDAGGSASAEGGGGFEKRDIC
jgi:hypothetical protein